MRGSNRATNKEWIEHWRRIGPKLEAIQRWELEHFDYEQQLPVIDALLQLGVDNAISRPSSGLVELQRILAQGRK